MRYLNPSKNVHPEDFIRQLFHFFLGCSKDKTSNNDTPNIALHATRGQFKAVNLCQNHNEKVSKSTVNFSVELRAVA